MLIFCSPPHATNGFDGLIEPPGPGEVVIGKLPCRNVAEMVCMGLNIRWAPIPGRAAEFVADRLRLAALEQGKKPGKTAAKKPGTKAPGAAFRDPETGAAWSGRGLKPKWLTARLAEGRALADFDTRAGSAKGA